MNVDRVAVIGIDSLSASIALGLRAQDASLKIIGYDESSVVADLAHARDVFDQVESEPGQACQDADLVIISVPLSSVQETFASIASQLQPGCVVTDTLRLKAPIVRWAEESLPETVSFIGGHPILNPALIDMGALEDLDDARADLLKEALYCFIIPPGASQQAIETCSELSRTLEAHPFFIDAAEHDGLQAGVEGLLDVLTVALLRASLDAPGWHEMRKFADRTFATATQAIDAAAERQADTFLNRENIIHRLDLLVEELMRLRNLLARGDDQALAQAFADAAEGRERWIKDRQRGMWVKDGTINTRDVAGVGEQIGQMLFGGLAARLREPPSRSQDK